MIHGIKSTIYPVKDITKAKELYSKLLGTKPYFDEPYYVGFRIKDQEIGLDPNGHNEGMTGPVSYWQVTDIKESLQLFFKSGTKLEQDVKDVGGGILMASVKDTNKNIIGLIQLPKNKNAI